VAYQRPDGSNKKLARQKEYEERESLEEVLGYKILPYKERGISQEVMEKYEVRCAVDPKDGKTPIAFYFPSYNKKGKLTGFSKQDLTKQKEEEGHWTAIGSVTIGNKLFGQQYADTIDRKKRTLIVTEGQIDCLSVFQACTDDVKNTKYEGLEPFVVSIPMGTANAAESVLQNLSWVEQFEEFVSFFDNDSCTEREKKKNIVKGLEAREEVLSSLIGTGLGLFSIVTKGDYKDASDMLQDGEGTKLAKLVMFGKEKYTPEKIISAGEIPFEDIISPPPTGVIVEDFPKLMDKLWGLQKRVLTLVCAPSGVGKTTGVSVLSKGIEKSGARLGKVFLEEQVKETLQRTIAEELKVNYLKFKRDPLKHASREQVEAIYDRIVKDDSIVFLNHFGSIPIAELMQKIRYLHLVKGCEYIVLDHLSMVISGLNVTDERKEIDLVMTELAAFCASHDVGIIVVCHLNRGGTADQFKTKKGEEDEPYWVRVTKESLRGSSALEQLSFVILGLEPEILPSRERGRVRWVILKNRPAGILGEADIWKLNESTWNVELYDE
jgi:hypothetical protein